MKPTMLEVARDKRPDKYESDQDVDIDDEEKITADHYMLIKEFGSKNVERDQILLYLQTSFQKQCEDGQLFASLEAKGEAGSTILHVLVDRWTQPSPGYRSLFEWLMLRYENLYKHEDEIQRTILERAARGRTSKESKWSFTEFFVENYPKEVLQLIEGKPKILITLLSTLTNVSLWERLINSLSLGVFTSTDKDGNPFLHNTAQFDGMLREDEIDKRCRVLQKIIHRFPPTLQTLNDSGESVYQYRKNRMKMDKSRFSAKIQMKVDGEKSQNPLEERSTSEDRISFLLLNEILHLDNRDAIRGLLHLSHEETREFELDLSGLNKSLTIVRKQSLIQLLANIHFEPILKLARIPEYNLDTNDKYGLESLTLFTFESLKAKGVRKIIRVEVNDNLDHPHSDEAILQALRPFDIEYWDWRKLDLSSDLIFDAAPSTRRLHLYFSGNRGVIRGWMAPDGLPVLKMLEVVHVSTYLRNETPRYMKQSIDEFIDRMRQPLQDTENLLTIHISTEAEAGEWNTPRIEKESRSRSWLSQIEQVASFISQTSKNIGSANGKNNVRVAIIGDGVDVINMAGNLTVKSGISFVDQSPAWYISSTGYGTEMTNLVQRVCPVANFYIAKLAIADPEILQNVTRAIKWAIHIRVNVILLGFTLDRPKEGEDMYRLESIIRDAQRDGLAIFQPVDDEESFRQDDYNFSSRLEIFQIGSMKTFGSKTSNSYLDKNRRFDFLFPGEDPSIQISGSSVSAALATGLAALLLYCIKLCDRDARDSHGVIRAAFRNLVSKHSDKVVSADLLFRWFESARDNSSVESPDIEGLRTLIDNVLEHRRDF